MTATPVTIRSDLRPGDLGRMIELEATVYATEYGFDRRFEAYVAETLAEFGRRVGFAGDRLWLVECGKRLVGSIGIVEREAGSAQLRWFLLAAEVRGQGLGHRLLAAALAFCRGRGYQSVYLWTVSGLDAAAHLYLEAGFVLTDQKPPEALWGRPVSEQRYDLRLASGALS